MVPRAPLGPDLEAFMRLPIVLILAATAVVQADILHLRDGSRYYGRLVSQDERTIVFRIASADGQRDSVRSFTARQVGRIERTGRRDVAPPSARAEAKAEGPRPDYIQMVREGFELLNDENLPAAVRALQRAVSGANEGELRALEALCRRVRGEALDDLLARTRIQVAARAGHGRGFRLRNATGFERAALGRRLRAQSETLLARRHQQYTVSEWTAHVDQYKELRPDARRLVADASRAAALIAARLRYDPALADDRAERVRLSGLHVGLTRLAGHVLSMPGVLDLDPEDGWVDPAFADDDAAATTQPAASSWME
jgi:hypothetical protein